MVGYYYFEDFKSVLGNGVNRKTRAYQLKNATYYLELEVHSWLMKSTFHYFGEVQLFNGENSFCQHHFRIGTNL